MSRDKRGVVNPVVAGYLQTSPYSSSAECYSVEPVVMSVASLSHKPFKTKTFRHFLRS
jgi:hypothetical protein